MRIPYPAGARTQAQALLFRCLQDEMVGSAPGPADAENYAYLHLQEVRQDIRGIWCHAAKLLQPGMLCRLSHGKGESVMDMSMFQREQGYRLCLSVLEQLRDKGLLTAEEFVQARAVLIEKYDPPISALSLENP